MTRFESLQDRIDELEERIEELESGESCFDKHMERIEKKLEDKDEVVDSLCERIAALEPKFKVGQKVIFRGRHLCEVEAVREGTVYSITEDGKPGWGGAIGWEMQPAPEPLAPLKERMWEKMVEWEIDDDARRDIMAELEKGE